MDGGSPPRGLRVLYLTTWAYGDGLSVASARPPLRALAARSEVSEIVYATFDATERPTAQVSREIAGKVRHSALVAERRLAPAGALAARLPAARRLLRREAASGVDLVVCRGATAAGLGVSLKRRHGIPLVVESFEPHADYMAAAGEWQRFGPKYIMQRRIERQAIARADLLVTVSEGYADHLARAGVARKRLAVLPCRADPEVFRPDAGRRAEIRARLGLSGPVCVYAGKFGGLYLGPVEAARVLTGVREAFSDDGLSILILTPGEAGPVRLAFAAAGLGGCTSVFSALPEEVPGYLDAADFGISFHRSSPWSFAFSPIKHSEYWASGLPVLCPAGVGDDARRIPGTGLGSVADFGDDAAIITAAHEIRSIAAREGSRAEVRNTWLRSFDAGEVGAVYAEVIRGLVSDREAAW